MAKKGAAKGTAGYDYFALSPEQKAKIQALSETYPEAAKDHIAIVLQYYNFDQDKATDALTADGGTTALNNWNSTENSQNKIANKNKKKNKKKNRKDNGSIIGVAALATDGDAEDSSSLHSSNIDFDGEKEHSAKPDLDNDMAEKVDEDVLQMCNNVVSSSCERQTFVDGGDRHVSGERVETPEESKSDDGLFPSLDVDSIENNNSAAENVERLSPKEMAEDHSRHYSSKHTYNRQRHGSYRHSKLSSMSEDNASAMQTSNVMKNRSYVKSQKDLSRQSVSLQNILLKVENKLEESSKCMKNAFIDVRSMLDKKQAELELQMENVKQEALALLTSRLNLAGDLKVRVERASTAPDSEWLDLRADIKQFVTERKYDDEFGKTIWFQWSMDTIVEEIKKFGEVVPVKNNYSQRNSVSRNQSSPELSQHDLDSKTDGLPQEQADHESSVCDSGHDGGEVKVEKEASRKVGQGGNHSRIFSNQNYRQQNNFRGSMPNRNYRGGRGYYKGHGNSGGYRSARFDNYNTGYRQFGGAERYDHRQQQQQQQYSQDKPDYHQSTEEKTSETGVPHISDGNNASAAFSSYPREQQQQQQRYVSRNQHRRPYMNKYNGQRAFNPYGSSHVYHNKPQRANTETTSSGDNIGNNSTNYDQAHQEKKDVMNGF